MVKTKKGQLLKQFGSEVDIEILYEKIVKFADENRLVIRSVSTSYIGVLPLYVVATVLFDGGGVL